MASLPLPRLLPGVARRLHPPSAPTPRRAPRVTAGALARLEWLFLNGNQIGNAAISAFASALDGAGSVLLPNLQQLWLHENEIGDEGVAALFAPLAQRGALPSLTTLSLDHNRIRRAGVVSIVDAIHAGALLRCKNILLNDNPAGKRPQQDVADALQQRAARK